MGCYLLWWMYAVLGFRRLSAVAPPSVLEGIEIWDGGVFYHTLRPSSRVWETRVEIKGEKSEGPHEVSKSRAFTTHTDPR